MISHVEVDAVKKVLSSKGYPHIPPLVLYEALEAAKKALADAEGKAIASDILLGKL